LDGIGSADLKMSECADGVKGDNSAMVENFLKLDGGLMPLLRSGNLLRCPELGVGLRGRFTWAANSPAG
jgi:hypothetical protein